MYQWNPVCATIKRYEMALMDFLAFFLYLTSTRMMELFCELLNRIINFHYRISLSLFTIFSSLSLVHNKQIFISSNIEYVIERLTFCHRIISNPQHSNPISLAHFFYTILYTRNIRLLTSIHLLLLSAVRGGRKKRKRKSW